MVAKSGVEARMRRSSVELQPLSQLRGLLWGKDLGHTQACLDPAQSLTSKVIFTIPTKPGLLSDRGWGTNTSPLGPQNPQISKRKMSGHLPQAPWGLPFLGRHWAPLFRD